ncbi:ERI1 exoribonuclease 3 [Tulasnella sp. JGI-2019a]|nr:ERI1 exoribonuclease 3 [Tulasnella sp. JGI-2019a]KAG9002974.1 ERI1 exoribonuclease 3 [Tulasnella sp. JGI-2019a]KAG9032333.1 ERI1 exoribonuclease 3 [Tulasnella sp. JGI-2019a]
MTTQQTLKYLLVLDFEATCGEKGFPVHEQEIIEFPTLLYNIEERKIQATFAEYVRPVRQPTLTEFCTGLTGITQETVDKADVFPQVWKRFNEFLTKHKAFEEPESFAFVTCGAWDLTTMLPKQLKYEASVAPATSPISITLPSPFDRVINIKKPFTALYKTSSDRGMAGMLSLVKLKLEGRHHSGIDDCRNISRIVGKMLQDGWIPEIPAKSSTVPRGVRTAAKPPATKPKQTPAPPSPPMSLDAFPPLGS